jgi:heme exporter protein D
MQFDSLIALWEMKGHGPFVWSAYAIAAATLIALVWVPLKNQRRFFRGQQLAERRRQLAQRAAIATADNRSA